MSKSRIGWIGLGHMGSPMAANLIKAGFAVTLYNRTAGKAKSLGAPVATSPAALARESDVIVTMVSDDPSQEAVLFGKDGVVEGVHPGLVVINMGTISPPASRAAAERLAATGVEVLDAPVSGSVKPAEDGKLVILVGGKEETLKRCQPIFDVLGKKTFHFGPSGQGAMAKLAINMMLGMTIEALAESVVFGQAKGLDRDTLLDMIGETACASPIVNLKLPTLHAGQYPAAFPLKHMAKDFRLALAAGEGVDIPSTRTVAASFATAEAKGLGDDDVMAVIKVLEKTR